MSAIVDGKFTCNVCGKRFPWKPQLAGKRARCACGTVLVIPEPSSAAEPQAEDDLYDIAEPPAAVAMPVQPARPAVHPVAYESAPTERERKRFSSETLLHRPRDIYIPASLLLGAFVVMMVWAVSVVDAGAAGVIIVAAFTAASTVVKTVVLIGLALIFAPMMGISFGGFWTAVLKFAAIIVFTDVALLWLGVLMDSVAGGPGQGRTGRRMLLVTLFATAALIAFLSHYLFDMDRDETAMFALPFAAASWLIGVFIRILLVSLLD